MSENDIRSIRSFANKIGIDCSNLLKKKKGIIPFTDRDILAISYGMRVSRSWIASGVGDKYLGDEGSVSCEMLDENTRLRIEKARLEEKTKCLESENQFLKKNIEQVICIDYGR